MLSAKIMVSLGPAGRREAIWSDNSFLAATKYGLPGPSIFRHLGTSSVPKAAAATA